MREELLKEIIEKFLLLKNEHKEKFIIMISLLIDGIPSEKIDASMSIDELRNIRSAKHEKHTNA